MNLIRKMFNDYRELTAFGVDMYYTEDGEIVLFKTQEGDFTPESLATYVDIAEKLSKKENCFVQVYIAMDPHAKVTVKEMTIQSDAEFSIKLGLLKEDPYSIILQLIAL